MGKTGKPSSVVVPQSKVIVEELQTFFDKDNSRTKIGRLTEMYDEIEKKIEGGMSLKNVLAVLNKNGEWINLSTLTKSLNRIRNKREGKKDIAVNVEKSTEKPKVKKFSKKKDEKEVVTPVVETPATETPMTKKEADALATAVAKKYMVGSEGDTLKTLLNLNKGKTK